MVTWTETTSETTHTKHRAEVDVGSGNDNPKKYFDVTKTFRLDTRRDNASTSDVSSLLHFFRPIASSLLGVNSPDRCTLSFRFFPPHRGAVVQSENAPR